ncbi:hypothetical protein STRIP9103_04227 [Streptomyces ipomoeae 91-03]|uniref:Uncharacterized protein n=1 Tax=Streptomyces ipomoeae 91-03 TaxID=698759 RepID=L1L180_9ACTN|nr:hypothetical protein STRIP9103_04227 [Streptomyces ipomoeae 91-03]
MRVRRPADALGRSRHRQMQGAPHRADGPGHPTRPATPTTPLGAGHSDIVPREGAG